MAELTPLDTHHHPPLSCAMCRYWECRSHGLFGACALTRVEPGTDTRPASLAWADGFEGEVAELLTKPTFGCVQWAGRPADG